jgi:hypothetical protein
VHSRLKRDFVAIDVTFLVITIVLLALWLGVKSIPCIIVLVNAYLQGYWTGSTS